ncbi:MAG: iron ABC transporter permease [Bacteroidales bacterium]|nr:iron ABC transporter permease [Bacteroidales bacterium]
MLTNNNSAITNYKKYRKKRFLFLIVAAACLFVLIVIGVSIGSVRIPLSDLISALFGDSDDAYHQIIWKIRMPRVFSAAIAGIALSVSGAVMQSILRNPLGSPFTLGISGASAFGAAFGIIIIGAGTSQSNAVDAVLIDNHYLVTASAFVFSIAATFFIFLIARFKGASPETMILTGIVLTSLFGAGISFLQFIADDVQLSSIVFWTFGDLGRASWEEFIILTIIVIPALIYFLFKRWDFNAMDSGDELAQSLGVNVSKTRLTAMLVASLCTAAAVSFFGIIAFVGLVVPHIVRRIIGGDNFFLIPGSALFGAVFLLLADTVARSLFSPMVLPVGILTSFLGAPLFLYLLIKGLGKGYW